MSYYVILVKTPLHTIHSNFWVVSMQSLNGYAYSVNFIDEYSSYIDIFSKKINYKLSLYSI